MSMENWAELIESCKKAECGGCTALEDPSFTGNPDCSMRWKPIEYVQEIISGIHNVIKKSKRNYRCTAIKTQALAFLNTKKVT